MRRQLPTETFIPLFEAASLAAELSGTPEAIAREKIKIAAREAVVPMMVSNSADGPWRRPKHESENPHPNYDIDVEASTYISQIFSCHYGEDEGEFKSYIFSPTELHARISWAAYLARYFPDIDYLRAAKPRSGRPPKHDWPAFDQEVGLWIFENGVPERLAELNQHMTAWCEKRFAEAPVDSAIRSRVRLLVNTYRGRLPTGKK